MNATTTVVPKVATSLVERAHELGYTVEENDGLITLYSGSLVAFVAKEEAVWELFRDIKPRGRGYG